MYSEHTVQLQLNSRQIMKHTDTIHTRQLFYLLKYLNFFPSSSEIYIALPHSPNMHIWAGDLGFLCCNVNILLIHIPPSSSNRIHFFLFVWCGHLFLTGTQSHFPTSYPDENQIILAHLLVTSCIAGGGSGTHLTVPCNLTHAQWGANWETASHSQLPHPRW